MIELLAVLALYIIGVCLIAAGAFILFGPGVCLIVIGCFALAAGFFLTRGIARAATD